MIRRFFEEYAKHTALNVGQALQGIRYFYSHPDIDAVAPRGTLEHVARSARLRSRRVANDFFFAAGSRYVGRDATGMPQVRMSSATTGGKRSVRRSQLDPTGRRRWPAARLTEGMIGRQGALFCTHDR